MIADAGAAPEPDEMLIATTEGTLGRSLIQLAEYAEAEEVLRRSMARLVPIVGEGHVRVAQARTFRAEALGELGRYAEADEEIAAGLEAASAWAPSQAAGYVVRARIALGRLRMEQGRLPEAVAELQGVLDTMLAWQGPERDQSAVVRRPLAEALQRLERLPEAEQHMRQALQLTEAVEGPGHPTTERIRIALADIVLRRGHPAEARQLIGAVDRDVFGLLPQQHPILAQLRRVEGFLALAEQDLAAARAALTEAHAILSFRHGAGHWRTLRARNELALVPAGPAVVSTR